MKALFVVIFLLAGVGRGFCGWDSLQWGMTLEEVKAAHKTVEKVTEFCWKLPNREVAGGVEVSPQLWLNKLGKLEAVELSWTGKGDRPSFDGLRKALTAKYGPPYREQSDESGSISTAEWRSGDTLIELRHTLLSEPPMAVTIGYRSIASETKGL